MNVKTRIASVGVAGALLLGGAAAAPAQAAGPVVTGGLVNVTVVDVLNNTQLQVAVPINVAAAICGVTVNVLSTALAPTGTQTFTCPASTGDQTITASR
jgi:hypothetical protein